MDLQELGWGNMNWIDLAQNRDRCRVLVNAVTKLRFNKMRGTFLLIEELLAFQERLCSME
jgi:hypothetical protein